MSATSYAGTGGMDTIIVGTLVLFPAVVIAVQSSLPVWLCGVSAWSAMGTSALATVFSISVTFSVAGVCGLISGILPFPLVAIALVLSALLANTSVIVGLTCRPRNRSESLRLVGVQAGTAVVWFVAACLAMPNMQASTRSTISVLKFDMRSMATGLEAYYVDHDAHYPTTFPLAAMLSAGKRRDLRKAGGIDLGAPVNLTTPIAYIAALPLDRFSPGGELPFAYYADTNGFIIFSPGYDKRYDIVPQVDYSSAISQPSPRLLLKCYDPTNGTYSPGDVMRVKQ